MLGLSVRPSAFLRGTIACTGIEFCKLALSETKGRAETIRLELEKRLPDFDTPITINVNGCPNSCARFQVADIGFKGMVQKGPDGDEDAFQVHLGGLMGERRGIRPQVPGFEGHSGAKHPIMPSGCCADTSPGVKDGESFADYVLRAEEEWLL